jgi:hypothetical protein
MVLNTMSDTRAVVGRGDETALSAISSSVSAVSWAAVLAGAVAAIAVTFILLELGLGLGLTTVSAWDSLGSSVTRFAAVTAVWLILVQWIASGIGGYIAGRLRTKWVGVHTDEVFFRDTAHGFLAWAVASLAGVAIFAAAASSALEAGGKAAGGAAQDVAQTASGSGGPAGDAYYADLLFRPANPGPANPGTADADHAGTSGQATVSADDRAEATRILGRDLVTGSLPPDDRAYLAQRIAARTGLSEADTEKRIDAVTAQIKSAEAQLRQAAETARKATASASIAGALSMVVGAFVACVAAALGGRLRDAF